MHMYMYNVHCTYFEFPEVIAKYIHTQIRLFSVIPFYHIHRITIKKRGRDVNKSVYKESANFG